MQHLLHVFFIKTGTSVNHDRAEKVGQQLFRRVNTMSEEVFEKEQDDVLEGLDMICPVIRDDRLPLFLNLFESGEVKQRLRVRQVAAELGMQFANKSCTADGNKRVVFEDLRSHLGCDLWFSFCTRTITCSTKTEP
jgi:hypothetical protein